jgi:hypothetical protein
MIVYEIAQVVPVAKKFNITIKTNCYSFNRPRSANMLTPARMAASIF